MHPSTILHYLADLAAGTGGAPRPGLPEGATPETLDLTRSREPAEWLGTTVAMPLLPPGTVARDGLEPMPARLRSTETVRHLATLDVLQPTEHLLRVGWVVVAGTVTGAELATGGGTTLAPVWAQLIRADEAVRAAAGCLAEVAGAREDRRRQGRAAAADLATALRAGRRQRRRLLGQIAARQLVTALPLWVGTLRDVDELLPDMAGVFDLVVLDEASQIDQLAGAGALLRARRAVVVGDPRQLRHVSFVPDELVARTVAAHRLDALGARLDVRRASVLDVAAAAAPVTWLDEHHRSVPHLIDFSARRFYDGRLHVATRHPANESADAIEVVRVAAGADPGAAELDAALGVLARLVAGGRTDLAVVSPFREVADAAQAALLAAYDLDEVERLRLRVGTVHAFQGAEADHVVLVVDLGPDDPAGRRRFVEDPHLFNVMVTRARRSLVVVTSLPPRDAAPSPGLLDEFLRHADRPPPTPPAGPEPAPWVAALAAELAAVGLAVRAGYPVGRWSVDLCLGTDDAVAVEATVHPDGIEAHIARRRALEAAGWRHADGYATRWEGDPTRAAIELAAVVRQDGEPRPGPEVGAQS